MSGATLTIRMEGKNIVLKDGKGGYLQIWHTAESYDQSLGN